MQVVTWPLTRAVTQPLTGPADGQNAPVLRIDAAGSVVVSQALPGATVRLNVVLLSAPTLSLDAAGSVVISGATPDARVRLSVT